MIQNNYVIEKTQMPEYKNFTLLINSPSANLSQLNDGAFTGEGRLIRQFFFFHLLIRPYLS